MVNFPLPRMGTVALVALLGSACPTTSTTSGSSGETGARGRLTAFTQAGALHVALDADAAPLALAASISVEGANFAGPAVTGDAAAVQDLFRQNAVGNRIVRFAVADSRGVRMQRVGTVVRIPLQGTPTRVEIKDVSAAEVTAQVITVDGFDGPPEVR